MESDAEAGSAVSAPGVQRSLIEIGQDNPWSPVSTFTCVEHSGLTKGKLDRSDIF
jgi:hypothetical protein